jgi:FixJ family two-component response regulator
MASSIRSLPSDLSAQIIGEFDAESLRKFVMLNQDAADLTWKTLAQGLGVSMQNRTEEEYRSEVVTKLKANRYLMAQLSEIRDFLGEGTPMKILLEAVDEEVEGENDGLETFI